MIIKDKSINSNINHPISESMGLAGINPIVGTNNGVFIANRLSSTTFADPDLKDFDISRICITRTIDKDDRLIKLDKNGKLVTENQWKELGNSKIELYKICTEDCEEVMNNLLEELKLPYEQRPVHNLSFLYEVFTGNILYSNDQLDIEPLLEKIELEKISKIISGDAINMENQYLKMKGQKKESNYVPDSFTLSNQEQLKQYEENKEDRRRI